MDQITKGILDLFNEINKIPRCSKNEERISNWLIDWAASNGFSTKRDSALNVVIEVPATKGYEDKPIVILQGHMDMVCEKTPDSKHNFSEDPIDSYIDGDWLKAKNTTLGADDGIALAIALYIAKNLPHPHLELLFTVDEETGLTGANLLDSNMLKGKILVNVDSEDEGVFTIGCAGGRDTKINLPIKFEKAKISKAFQVKVSKLQGGHSGVDIKLQRANANILLARILKGLSEVSSLKIVDIKGGSAHNAISRNAQAVVLIDDFEVCKNVVSELEKTFKNEYKNIEPNLECSISEVENEYNGAVCLRDSERIVNLMLALPHGVFSYSNDVKGLVETSDNFATVELNDSTLKILLSQRSSVLSKLDFLTSKIEAIGRLSGAEVESSKGYPSWEPDFNSTLLKKAKDSYKNLFNIDPKIEVIHAGLECGIIGAKYEGMEMISIGPTVKHPHSPQEKLFIPSIKKLVDFLQKFFNDL